MDLRRLEPVDVREAEPVEPAMTVELDDDRLEAILDEAASVVDVRGPSN